ncbi:hypothetical protein RclHR1_03200017 [Rhizophagus clarus]|uniref:Mitochondria-eating protein C-terminal domain-containing protein n=1 Tax=Rhizophagus clarus TaxID=94130 RepID=A0A2Z6R7R0_9GLOM|nr:hypothetical protein RclHR1_03200017 [Rhizophagus clarus]GES97303.1 hypothetical protein GLOIN_2v1488771 [Rhizophagus clarus]
MSYENQVEYIDIYSTRAVSKNTRYLDSHIEGDEEYTENDENYNEDNEDLSYYKEKDQKFNDNDDYIEQYIPTTKSLEDENRELKDEIQETNNNLDQFKLLYNELENNYRNLINENIEQERQYQNEIKLYKQRIEGLTKTKEIEGRDIENLKKENEELNIKYDNLNKKYKDLENQLKDLDHQNVLLKEEAQCAAIIATNFSSSDYYQNHNIKLNKDILTLQNILDDYVTNLKFDIDININEVKELLLKYGCQTAISDKKPIKPLIRAVLQRHVLEEILKQADFYFKCSSKEHHLESIIVSQTTSLINLMEKFYNERHGDNEITNLMLIRLRQQVYSALSIRGFNNIKKPNEENSKHNFVDMISKKLNEMINKYRRINDIETRNYVNALAEDLVQNIIKIFYFHLFIQEPIAQYRWINNNEKVNKSYMKGSWDDDNVENMVVGICSFPLIFKHSHQDEFKVFTPAIVFLQNSANTGTIV